MSEERDPDVRPTWDERGLPLCDDACPNFDGKRCKAMGFRPDRFCEPMLLQLLSELHFDARERDGQRAAETSAVDPGSNPGMGAFSVDGELRDVLLSDVDDGCPICGVNTSHSHHVVINPPSASAGGEGRLRPGSDEGAAGKESKS
jgi:hypothetical protein